MVPAEIVSRYCAQHLNTIMRADELRGLLGFQRLRGHQEDGVGWFVGRANRRTKRSEHPLLGNDFQIFPACDKWYLFQMIFEETLTPYVDGRKTLCLLEASHKLRSS